MPVPFLVRPNPPEIVFVTFSEAVPTLPPEFTVQLWLAPRVIFKEMVWVMAVVFAELVTAMLGVAPPNVMLPPEKVMFEEEPSKVSEFASTDPETVMVPVPSWFALVPKFKALVVLVVVVPERAVTPVEEELQPCVALFVVGAAQVPPAVPKPAAESLESQ